MTKKPTIEEIVAKEGVDIEEGHAASHNTALGSVQINAQNVTLSNVSLSAGHSFNGEALPKVKPVKEMDKEESSAFQEGQWDGIDRRTRGEDTKEYERELKRRARRNADRREFSYHYVILIALFLLAAGWGLAIILTQGVIFHG